VDIEGKVVAVTGGASGIGRALARAFAAAGAKGVGVADLDDAGAKAVADEFGGVGYGCDVSVESDIQGFAGAVEGAFGPIDIFCSNAGIPPTVPDDPDDDQWNRQWGVHVMAHVYAARVVGDAMAARGGGYLVNTASAAGLLAQVDSAPYSVTKHAAVGCAEWLAIKYADKGVRVSVLCPQAVDTAMIQSRPNSPGTMSGDVLPPEAAAQAVLDGVRAEKFLILSHPVAREYMDRKHNDIDRWLRGMGRLRKKVLGEE
jgi:NAD(P)-dependent dehydrogenase (short-subunit alcohol dehydrogenase family)